MLKLWGREPALILAVIASAIMVCATFVYPLSIEQQGALNGMAMIAVGIITAWRVAEDGGLAFVIGAAKAVIALALAFGLNMAAESQAVAMTFVTVLAQAVIIRPNVIAPTKADGAEAKGKTLN